MALLTQDVDPLWIARYDYRPGWRLPQHQHSGYFQLIQIISGNGTALLGATSVPLESRQVLFLPPGFEHGLEIARGSIVCTLDTKFRVRHSALRRACLRLPPVHMQSDRRIQTLLETMHAEAELRGAVANEICQTLLTQVLLLLLQKSLSSSAVAPALRLDETDETSLCGRVGHFLRENSGRRIDQKVLSRAFNYSYRHLHARWHAKYGESPLQSLRRHRVETAMQIIRYSDYELKRIAEMTGFASIHHFSRVFREIAGDSPARWRDREKFSIGRDIVLKRGFVNQALTQTTTRGSRVSRIESKGSGRGRRRGRFSG